MGDSSRMTRSFINTLWRRAALLVCLLFAAPAWSADILLTAAEDGAGVQAFAQALAQQRPEDHVTFTALKDLPAPSQLPANTRLILLDLPGLDWRLQDTQGPPTLVLRISRLQAHQRLGTTQHPRISLLWSDPPLERQLRLITGILPKHGASACSMAPRVNSSCPNCASTPRPGPGNRAAALGQH